MMRRALCVVLVSGLALAGCTATPDRSQDEPSDVETRAQSLWLDRTAYVGDSSKVSALVEEAGFGSMGSLTLALQTDAAPYGVTIDFGSVGKPFDTVDFTPQATLLLGLVGNLDRVDITSGADLYTFTSAETSKRIGYDVKALGQDEKKLEEYLQSLED